MDSKLTSENVGREMAVWQHLEELRWAIIKSIVVVALTTTAAFAFTDFVWAVLRLPFARIADQVELIYSGPLDAFLVKVKLALLAGLVAAAPFVLGFLWSFVAPGLTRRERCVVYCGVGVGSVFFGLGVGFGYLLLPYGLQFLVSFSVPGFGNLWPVVHYLDFCLRLLLGFGLVFELPVVLTLLVRLDLVRVATLRRFRPYAVIAAFVLAAVLTPPDIVSQIALALPIIGLYEMSILLGRWQEHSRPG